MRDEDERRRDRRDVRLGAPVVDQPAFVIICGRDQCPADDERCAPDGLCIPKRRRIRELSIREERAAENEYHARQYFPIYFSHTFIIAERSERIESSLSLPSERRIYERSDYTEIAFSCQLSAFTQ